ncbi:Uncharacterized conserved protein YccT, UPF0319 family [Marinobacter daqiaonensis]|uniref:Uncharacterized conserved protein YccT, UPF0319 family n=1 Tax=Marinobacter daqiaonensis TaxID=650891 RepID=A0A1I6K4I9_9GAMM|nr:DUF2057 family protein [Marinobacter daqiaonensis]SFR86175.1 Uncharacterized conserved protein YccT, UPF0319 family [Marinobacter daqiaonensis]
MRASNIKAPRLLLAALALVFVAGCSSNGLTRIKTWDGEAVAEPAVLKAPSTIKVKQVNGKRTGNFLVEDLALDYELRPGPNTVVFTYKTIWAKSGVIRAGESSVHVVETRPQQVVFDAQPGEVYRFDLPELRKRSEATEFAENFSAAVVADDGERVARSEPYRGQSENTATVSRSPSSSDQEQSSVAPAAQAPGVSTGESPGSRVDTLEALKVLWERASGDEKREFLRWAFD